MSLSSSPAPRVHPSSRGATPDDDSSRIDAAPPRRRVRLVAVVVGVMLGLGPFISLHIYLLGRARADASYAQRLTDEVGARARTVADRLQRVEQDLVSCAGFLRLLPAPRPAFEVVGGELLTRHAVVDAVGWADDARPDGASRLHAAAPADAAATLAALLATAETRNAVRAALRTGRPHLARLPADAAHATLVTPFEGTAPTGSTHLLLTRLRLATWLAAAEHGVPTDATLAVALFEPGDDAGRLVPSPAVPGVASATTSARHDDRPLLAAGRLLVLRGWSTPAFDAVHRSPAGLGVPALALLAWEGFAIAVLFAGRAARAQALARQARTTRRIFRALVEGVVVADPDHRITFANEAAAALLGPRPPDDDACAWLARAPVVGPEGAPVRRTPADVLERALAGETVPESDWRLTKGGTDRWLAIAGRPLRQDGLPDAGAVVVLRDVSGRRRASAALDRLSRAIEQAADVVYITDREGLILYANPAFERTTGWRLPEAFGRTPRILKSGHHTREEYARLWRTITAGDVHHGTVINRRKDGTTYVADQTVTPIKDREGTITHFVAVAHDATERVERERRDAEMAVAADVQRRLAPREPPRVPGLDVAGAAFPAEATCGDAWDAATRPDGHLLLAVGDVSGHGVGPALLMAETRAYLRSLSATDLPLHQIVDRLAELLRTDLPDGTFVSLLLVEIDPVARTVAYTNAGHVPGFVLAADGALRATLPLSGRLLGMEVGPDRTTRPGPVLSDGDVLLLVTDGATDCPGPDGEPIEDDGLLTLARPLRARTAARFVADLHDALVDVSRGRCARDDVTIVVARVVPPPNVAA